MTAANNGGSTPEDDDPFGYLYEDGQAAGATPPGQSRGYGYPGPGGGQPGVPRTSYNQVRAVGERQYGGGQGHGQAAPQHQQGQPGYGQQPYGQPTAQYAAPETYPGGVPARSGPPPQRAAGGGRGPNTKGLLIGAIAVVGVVVLGITAALINDKDKPKTGADGDKSTAAPPAASQQPSGEPEQSGEPDEEEKPLPSRDAATLQLGGPARLGTEVEGAKGADGAYVMFNGTGGSASWSVEVPKAGQYSINISYAVPGKDAKTSLTVNGKKSGRPINMSNFNPQGDGEWSWTNTFAFITLDKGKNDLKISCDEGDTCEAILDRVSLTEGWKS
jgi:hypothetical protein